MVNRTLESYLTELETLLNQNAPDQVLTDELGIYDNYTILVNHDYNVTQLQLWRTGKFEEPSENGSAVFKNAKSHKMLYLPGTVELFTLGINKSTSSRAALIPDEDKKRQNDDYNMQLMLHDYQGKKFIESMPIEGKLMEGKTNIQALGYCVLDICREFVIPKRVPICLADSMTYKYKDDPSRIVYYDPALDGLKKLGV